MLIGEGGASPLRAAASVQGATCWATTSFASALVHPAEWYARPRRRPPRWAPASPDRPGRTDGDRRTGSSPTPSSCWRPVPAPPGMADDSGRRSPTCARSATPSGSRRHCPGPPPGDHRRRLDRARGLRGGPPREPESPSSKPWRSRSSGCSGPRWPPSSRAPSRPRCRPAINTEVVTPSWPTPPGYRHLADGSTLPADLVVVGVGARPTPVSAATAGLRTDNGVRRRSALRTSDPDVFATATSPTSTTRLLGRRLRVEHWDTAIPQGEVAAQNMLGRRSPTPAAVLLHRPVRPRHRVRRPPRPQGYDQVVIRARRTKGASPPSGSRTGRSWRACTSTTGTRSTRSDGSSTRQRVVAGLDDASLPLAKVADNLD